MNDMRQDSPATLNSTRITFLEILTLGTIFPIFITPMRLLTIDHDPVQAMHCLAVEPTLYICKVIACMYAIVSIKRLTIPGRTSVEVYTALS